MPDSVLSPETITRIKRWAKRSTQGYSDYHLDVSVEACVVTVNEVHAGYEPADPRVSIPLTQMRYKPQLDTWTLWWYDRHGRWHRCKNRRPTKQIDRLLTYIDDNPDETF